MMESLMNLPVSLQLRQPQQVENVRVDDGIFDKQQHKLRPSLDLLQTYSKQSQNVT